MFIRPTMTRPIDAKALADMPAANGRYVIVWNADMT